MLMRLLILSFILIIAMIKCFANQDTTYAYFDANRNATQKENAFYESKTTKESNSWHKQVFIVSNGDLYMDGYYADEKTHVPHGVIKYMGKNKQILDSCLFINGQLKARYRFYENGRMKNYIIFTDSIHVSEQGGYDKDGKIIGNYIVWRPADVSKK